MPKSDSSLTGSNVYRVVYSEWGSALDPESGQPMEDAPPHKQKITVTRERKGRKGKTVTVASGFQLTPQTLGSLAKSLKAQCGSGGTAKDTSVEIQGDHRDRVGEILKGLGYTVKYSGG